MQDLTPRQRDVFRFITSCIDERGYAPTLREIGESLGIRSTNGVHEHLRALEKKGYLTREGTKARTLRPANRRGRNLCVPLVGSLTPGKDPLSAENVWESLNVDRLLLGAGREHFVVRVGEDCPPGEGLSHGDYLFVRREGSVAGGELMVLLKNGKMTLQKKTVPVTRLGDAETRKAMAVAPGGGSSSSRGGGGRVLGVGVGYFRKL